MSRVCRCRKDCMHLTRGGWSAMSPVELLALEPMLRTLVDLADAFDQDGLQVDPECEIHGTRPSPHAECSCSGTRYSAVEWVAWLQLEIKSAAAAKSVPAGRPGAHEAANGRRMTRSLAVLG